MVADYETFNYFKDKAKKWAEKEYENEIKEREIINKSWSKIRCMMGEIESLLKDYSKIRKTDIQFMIMSDVCLMKLLDCKIEFVKKHTEITVRRTSMINDIENISESVISPFKEYGDLQENLVIITPGNYKCNCDDEAIFMKHSYLFFNSFFNEQEKMYKRD